ncbi:MAG: molybdopterin-dependent oxidoreductase [Solirubrobacteraceae bacterium]
MNRHGARRDLWLTSLLGFSLLVVIPVIAITGLLSNAAYDPRLAGNVLAQGRTLGSLDFYLFTWPTHPWWLYAATQGVHVSLGLAAFPIVLAKLWSVLPGLFTSAEQPSLARVLERLGLVLLIAGILFEFFTGFFEIEYFFPFGAQLITAHYYGAWVVIATFLLHAALKLPTAKRSLELRRAVAPLRRDLVHMPPPSALLTVVAASDACCAEAPGAAAPISRATVLATAAAGSLILLVQGVAPVIGEPVRRLALLGPRGNETGPGPNDFEVNGTAAAAGLTTKQLGPGWRLHLAGDDGVSRDLSRQQLRRLPQHSYSLPIACREGWSTTQHWTGVRLRDLAAVVGTDGSSDLNMQSLDGATASLASNQVADERSLLALRVNGVDLSPDHGFPARVIVPAATGVNRLKWIDSLQLGSAAS